MDSSKVLRDAIKIKIKIQDFSSRNKLETGSNDINGLVFYSINLNIQFFKNIFLYLNSYIPGLLAAKRLKDVGVKDIVILEASDDVGGTWYSNNYPGIACDVASHLYSYSFFPNPR